MLSYEEVGHIARLARLGLNAAELKKYRKDLSAILDYIAKLQEVNIEGVEPTSHSVAVKNVVRKDEAHKESMECVGKIMEQVPEREGGYVRTKVVL